MASGRCPAHQRVRPKDETQRKFYSSQRWRKMSEATRREHPICTVCWNRPSQQAHHLDGDWENNDPANRTGICRDCHLKESGRQHKAKAVS